jgi:hypothetical protein
VAGELRCGSNRAVLGRAAARIVRCWLAPRPESTGVAPQPVHSPKSTRLAAATVG